METGPPTLSVRPELERLRKLRKNDDPAGTRALENRLPQWLLIRLRSCPRRPRKGVHPWMYSVSRALHAYLDEEEIFALLWARTRNVGRVVGEREITAQIVSAKATAWRPCAEIGEPWNRREGRR
jgi:hypothetical protein